MTLSRIAFTAIFLLLAPGEAPCAPATVHDGASGPVAAWRAAMERGDLAALARMHDGATTAFPPNGSVVRGGDAILADYARLFAEDKVSVTLDEAHWIEAPPLVVSWGRTTLTLKPKTGGPDVVVHTRFTDAAIRTPEGWRYVIDHASPAKTP